MGEPLNGLDDKINVRGYFERILNERAQTELMRDKLLDERFESQEKALAAALTSAKEGVTVALLAAKEAVQAAFMASEAATKAALEASDKAINKAEQRLDGTLKGFPQEYARRMELEQMISALDETSTVLAQKVVDSAAALADAQKKAEERLAIEKEKTDERVDVRFKKLEEFQSRLTGMVIILPFVSGVIVYLLSN